MNDKTINLDSTDIKIIDCLKMNSRMQLKDISELVHLSAPAVAARIDKLESTGIIKHFTIEIDESKLNNSIQCFIILFMKNLDHLGLQKLTKSHDTIKEAHKISGHGCYLLKVHAKTQEELNGLLDRLSLYGTYQLNISISKIK